MVRRSCHAASGTGVKSGPGLLESVNPENPVHPVKKTGRSGFSMSTVRGNPTVSVDNLLKSSVIGIKTDEEWVLEAIFRPYLALFM